MAEHFFGNVPLCSHSFFTHGRERNENEKEQFWEGSSIEKCSELMKRCIKYSKEEIAKSEEAKRSDYSCMFSKVQVGRGRTPEQAAPASESAAVGEMRKEKKAMSGCSLLDLLLIEWKDRSISPAWDGDLIVTSEIAKGPGDTPYPKYILELNNRDILRYDLEGQPLLAKTYAILFPNLINANLPDRKRWKDVFSATFRTLRNALTKLSRDPNIVSNGHRLFKSASKLAVGMVVIGNTPGVGAIRPMAPEAAGPGSLQAGDLEKSSNFAFGVVACVGVLATIIILLKSFKWWRRHSIAVVTSAASAPAGLILNPAANMAQTVTVLRAWREIEYCEVVVARREEKGAYYAV